MQTVVTDGSWKVTSDGPVRANNYYDGEVYDARMEMPGWNEPGFVSGKTAVWNDAEPVAAPQGRLVAQPNPPVEVMHTLAPVSVSKIGPDTYILDMGQNMVGWVEMDCLIPAGSRVKLRFAELLNPDGSLYTANLRSVSRGAFRPGLYRQGDI